MITRLATLLTIVLVSGTVLSASLAPQPARADWCVLWGLYCEGGGGGSGPYGEFADYECDVTICRIGVTLLAIINGVLVPLLFAVAFITFLYGVANAYIFSRGDPEETSKGHKLILWGIIGFVVMLSLWGLVAIVSNTFGLEGSVAPPTPVSYPI